MNGLLGLIPLICCAALANLSKNLTMGIDLERSERSGGWKSVIICAIRVIRVLLGRCGATDNRQPTTGGVCGVGRSYTQNPIP